MKKEPLYIFIIDLVSISLAFTISIFIRQSTLFATQFGYIQPDKIVYLTSFIFISFLLMSIFITSKLYRIRKIELSAKIFTVLKAILTWTLTITACMYALKFDFSRFILFTTIIMTALFICSGRYIYYRHRRNNKHDDDSAVYIIGSGPRAEMIDNQIRDVYPHLSIVHLNYQNRHTLKYLRSIKGDDIFIADELLSKEQVMKILTDNTLTQHSFRVILDTFKLATGEILLSDINEIPSISISSRPHSVYMITKRIIDIILSSVGIIVLSPIWFSIIVVVLIESHGPVIIRQSRVGSNKKIFTLYKFRTMRPDVALYEYSPRDEADHRITRTGKFLRRFSLDELPQLYNVLRGDMSLVGPRPEMEFIVRKYEPWQKVRLNAKPGLTGLWQILGRKDIPLHENLEYDFYYVCNRSLILDSVIMLKTVPAVLFGRGAY